MNRQNIENENDDDFGDFGGFEGAEPGPDMPQAQAAPSPWAILSTGTSAGRPDLLCAQNRFPPILDPSDIPEAGSGDVNHNSRAQAPQPHAPIDLFGADFPQNGHQMNQAQIAENILDGTLNVGAAPNVIPPRHVNGLLPDIGLGINENRLFAQLPLAPSPGPPLEALPVHNQPALDLPPDQAAIVRAAPVELREAAQEGNVEANLPDPVEEDAGANIAMQEIVANRNALQEQINSVLQRNQSLEEELSRSQEELASSQSRLNDLQARHDTELGEMRKAGSDAVAIVVEQYKEQTQVLIAEQREVSQRYLMDALREQMKHFQDMLQAQRAEQEDQREQQRQETERQIGLALEEARQKQQEQFDAFLLAEKEKQNKALEDAVETERASCERKLRETIAAEQEQARIQMESLRTEHTHRLEEVQQSHEAALCALRENEKEIAREQMSELGREERDRRRDAVRTALSEAREDTQTYLQEQRQADARVRRRHLTSLDIFLETARQQISLLLDADSGGQQGTEEVEGAEGVKEVDRPKDDNS